MNSCFSKLHSERNGQIQVVVFYKYPKCSQTVLKRDIRCILKPLIETDVKLVMMGDFDLPLNEAESPFCQFHGDIIQLQPVY